MKALFKKVLIANRGEIAVRVIKTLREMGIGSLALYSDADEFSLHRLLADEAQSLGDSTPTESYLNIEKIIDIAKKSGADAIHPIQALADKMEPQRLKDDFGDKVSFCGGVDTQDLLVNGSPEDVRQKVAELTELFPTGLIISPSHEAILPDVPPENIEALFGA